LIHISLKVIYITSMYFRIIEYFYYFDDIDICYNKYLFDKYSEDEMRDILSPYMDDANV
jgi:hypothetical protein